MASIYADGAVEVMRGEKRQILGATARDPAVGGGGTVSMLPGTLGKRADGRIVRFGTFPTSELFALLRDWSGDPLGDDYGDSDAGLVDGLARSATGSLRGALFEARAAQLRAGRSRGWVLGFLSGPTIGHAVRDGLARRQAMRTAMPGGGAVTLMVRRV